MPISRSTGQDRAVATVYTATRRLGYFVAAAAILASCGVFDRGGDVEGFPDVDLGAPVEVYKQTPQRDLHVHLFGTEGLAAGDRGAVLFFHGGGFASTRVEQFERQAQIVADSGMVGIVVEYRVTAEGTSRADAVADGVDAVGWVRTHGENLGIDPDRIAIAGGSAGGALAVEASGEAMVTVLFNPAVGEASAAFVEERPTIVFHSREDTIVPFASAQAFCDAARACELVAFDQGDHGFFNDDPAFTETTDAMIDFLERNGW